MSNWLKKSILTVAIASMVIVPTVASAQLLITGVFDGPLPGGLPKGVELVVLNDIPDLSVYGLGSANNGGGTDGEEFTFPADSASQGDFIYVCHSGDVEFTEWFGFAPNYIADGYSMAINGDDAVELFCNGAVIDVFGDINTDGTGEPWEHLDSWAYRVDMTGPDGETFVLTNWMFGMPNAWDGELTNDTAAVPMPVGTYEIDPSVSADEATWGGIKAMFDR